MNLIMCRRLCKCLTQKGLANLTGLILKAAVYRDAAARRPSSRHRRQLGRFLDMPTRILFFEELL
jgi:hypothetical protein